MLKEEGDQLGDEEDFVFGEPEEGNNNDIHRRRSHRRNLDDNNRGDGEYDDDEEYEEEVPFFTPVDELEDILLDRFDVVFSALDNLDTYKQVSSDRLRDCYKVINDLEAYAMVLGRDLKEAESLSEAQKYSIKKLEGDIDLLMDEITTCSHVQHHHLGEEVGDHSGDNYVVASNRRSNNSIDGAKLATAINETVDTGRHEDAGVEGGSQDDVAAPSNGAHFDAPDATHPPHTHPSSITNGDSTTATALPQRRSSVSSVHSTSSAQGSRVPSRRKHDRSPSAHIPSRSHSPYVLPPPSDTGDVPTRRPTPAASQTGFRTSAEPQAEFGQVVMSPVARGPSSHAKKEKKSRTTTPSDLGGSTASAHGDQDPHNPLRHKSSSRQAKRGGNKRGGGFMRDDTPTEAKKEKKEKKSRVVGGVESSPQRHRHSSIQHLLSQLDDENDSDDEHTFPSSSAAATSPRAVVSVQADDGSHARIAALEAEIRRQIGLHEVVATTLTRYERSNNQLSLDNEHLLQECDALEDDLEAADETERRLKQKIAKLEDKVKRYKLRQSTSTSGIQSPSSSTPSPRQHNNHVVLMDGRGGDNAATTTTDISYERRSSTTTTTTTKMTRVSAAVSSSAHHAAERQTTDDDGSAPYKPPQSQDDDNDQHDTEEGGVEEEEEVEDGLVDTPPFGSSDNDDDENRGNGGAGGLSSLYRHPKPPRACSN